MFRELMTLDEAKQVIQRHFEPRTSSVETVPLLEAYDRVLAENVVSALNIPPFNRSTVDGYAVKAEDTFGADENKPIKLKISGTVSIGKPPMTRVKQGMAAGIVTGAPMPDGADAVVMIEYAEAKKDDVYVYSTVTKDENVMMAGADLQKGETVLKAGQLLGSREIGVLAAIGSAKAKVRADPRVAVLSTGSEITEPGRKLASGRIYDINAYSLSTAVLENGGKPVYLGVLEDDIPGLQKILRQALASADLVITSGGVSVGPKDVMPKVLNTLGKPGVIVCGIAIKPGKPVTVALIDRKLVFSLPGHPASALLVFHLLVSPIIRQMAGRTLEKPPKVKAYASMRIFAAKGRRTFITVKLKRDGSKRLVAEPVPTGLSGAITTLAKADGYLEIAENKQFIDADEEVTVQLFHDLRSI